VSQSQGYWHACLELSQRWQEQQGLPGFGEPAPLTRLDCSDSTFPSRATTALSISGWNWDRLICGIYGSLCQERPM